MKKFLPFILYFTLLAILTACGGGEENTGNDNLSQFPEVLSVTDPNGEQIIHPKNGVRVDFVSPVSPELISASSVTIENDSGETITIDVTWSVDRTSVSLIPEQPLLENSSYTFVALPAAPNASPIRQTFDTGNALSTDASLGSIDIDGVDLSPSFDENIETYSVELPNSVTEIDWGAWTTNDNASINFNSVEIGNNLVTSSSLSIGLNTFTLVVTAEDSVTTKTYTLTVNRAALSPDATLGSIDINGIDLSPSFDQNIETYSVELPNSVTEIRWGAWTTNENASINFNSVNIGNNLVTSSSLSIGLNTFTLVVTAEDGVTTKTYRLSVMRLPSSDATLSLLEISSILITPNFSPEILHYGVNLPNNINEISWFAAASHSTATVEFGKNSRTGDLAQSNISLDIGSNVFAILVTAEDGVTTKTYTLTVNRAALSPDATLGSIDINGIDLSPSFDKNIETYSVELPNSVTEIRWGAWATNENASINFNSVDIGNNLLTSSSLSIGLNTFTLVVTAENGVTTKTYRLSVMRLPSSDATLSLLEISSIPITPNFSPEILHYGVNLPNNINEISWFAAASHSTATVEFGKNSRTGDLAQSNISLDIGSNVFAILVTAEDGVTTKTYTLTVNRAALSPDATLGSIDINGIDLSPSFDENIETYSVELPNSVTEIRWGAWTTNEKASINFNSVDIGNNLLTSSSLSIGLNTFTLVVTAESGVTTKTYTLNVSREQSDAADLVSLNVDGYALTPDFDPNVLIYEVTVPNRVTEVQWSATSKYEDATFPNQSNVTGTVSYNFVLGFSENKIEVIVNSADGYVRKTYEVLVRSEPPGTNASLKSLLISRGTLSPVFNSAITSYTVDVPYSVETIKLLAEAEDSTSTIKLNDLDIISGEQSLPIDLVVGSNSINILVTAEDGVTSQNVALEIIRQTANDFAEKAFIKASNSDQDDYFGTSVALSGNTLVVGAYYEDSNATAVNGEQGNDATVHAGAAYVFERATDGSWSQTAYLKAFNADQEDRFGGAVAIHGNTIAVGAINEDTVYSTEGNAARNNAVLPLDLSVQNNGVPASRQNTGAVYLFERSASGEWQASGFLSGFGHSEYFGYALDMDANTLAIGAPGGKGLDLDGEPYLAQIGSGAGKADSGFVYIYHRVDVNSQWQFSAYMAPSDFVISGRFGEKVSIFKNTIAVGARKSSIATTSKQGAVYIFDCDSNDVCIQSQQITDTFGKSGDWFGYSLSLGNGVLAVGVPHEDNNAEGIDPVSARDDSINNDSGAVYLYEFNTQTSSWDELSYIKPKYFNTAGNFGKSVAIDGGMLYVGATDEASDAVGINHPNESTYNSQVGNGAVYAYDISTLTRTHYIKPSTKAYATEFGFGLAADNGLFIVSDRVFDYDNVEASQNRQQNSGAAYVFEAISP